MTSITSTAFTPIFFFIIIAIIVTAAIATNTSKRTQKTKRYATDSTYQRYIPQTSSQMELDIRLPYRRFKQLYPTSDITYDEYKKMQTNSAFKRSLSSQQNRRMVR